MREWSLVEPGFEVHRECAAARTSFWEGDWLSYRKMERQQDLRRQLEELNIHRRHARFTAMMEAADNLVVFTDDDRNILHINPAGQRLLGMNAAGSFRVLKLSDLYFLEEYERMEGEAIPAAEKTGAWEGETCIRHRAGGKMPVFVVIIVDKDADGKTRFISMMARDQRG